MSLGAPDGDHAQAQGPRRRHLPLRYAPGNGGRGLSLSDTLGASPEFVNGANYLYEIYPEADPNYSARATIPVLCDKKGATIASIEPRAIMRMLDTESEDFPEKDANFYPEDLREEIDLTLDELYKPCHTV
jgi:putative glutathione S-transferase